MTLQPRPTPAPIADSEALAQLFTEHYAKVFRAAQRITGNPADAEDVLQTVFVRLLRRQESAPLGADAAGYFYRSAVHGALDVVRARQRAGWAPLEEAELPRAVPAGESAPERDRENAQLRRALRLALARLSPRAAEMFALRYFEGLGNREIADLLGTSQGVVAVLLHRTRHRLRKELSILMGGTS